MPGNTARAEARLSARQAGGSVPSDALRGAPCPLFVFAGGGTGGHLYPALAIADALRRRLPRARFTFFGTRRPIEQHILDGTHCDSVPQTLPAFNAAPWRWPAVFRGYRRASLSCRARFEQDAPAVVIGTGGLASVPAVREAARMRIPTALLNPDAIPGRANRYLAGSVDLVFAQWRETVDHLLPSVKVLVCGCPVRAAFNRADKKAGIERFALDGNLNTLLVTGASQGARTVNQAVIANLPFIEATGGWQVLHLTGEVDHDEVLEAYRQRSLKATVLAYTDHMADALAAADLVVSRAGASTLAEITALGRASILMPYPYHRDMHQLANARCLVSAAGGSAARIVHDGKDVKLNGPALRAVLEQLMTDDSARQAVAAAARRIGRGQAATQIADHLISLAGTSGIPLSTGESEGGTRGGSYGRIAGDIASACPIQKTECRIYNSDSSATTPAVVHSPFPAFARRGGGL